MLFSKKEVDLGTCTHSINPTPAIYLNTTTTGAQGVNNDKVVFQSSQYLNFQTNSTIYVSVGATLRTTLTSAFNTARIGYFDDAFDKDVAADVNGSGVYFQLSADGIAYVGIRNFVSGTQVDTLVDQANWNFDTMDGSGASKDDIDFTLPQVYVFEVEMASSRIRLGFNVNGGVVWAHQFVNYNVTDESQLFSYNLPIRAELQNSATGTDIQGAAEMHLYSLSGEACGNLNASDYGLTSNPLNFSANTPDTSSVSINSAGEHKSIISVRLKTIYNRGLIWPKQLGIDNENGSALLWRLILNPIFTGDPHIWNSVADLSIAEYSLEGPDITIGTNTVVLSSGYISSQYNQNISALEKSYPLHSSIDGLTSDIVTFSIQYVRGVAKVRGSLSWLETT